jgi:hypothetical protein
VRWLNGHDGSEYTVIIARRLLLAILVMLLKIFILAVKYLWVIVHTKN